MSASKSHSPKTSSRRPLRLACLLIALVTVLMYLPAGSFEFSYFDDVEYVTDNGMVQAGLTGPGLVWALTAFHSSNWHPVTWLSHMIDCQLFGLNAGPQHLVNVMFHAANAVLFLVLWYRLTGALVPCAFAAALFAWHPLRVESVAWISERKDVLCAFFGLAALLAYRSYVFHKTHRTYAVCLGLFALSLLSKPMLVTLPFVFLLLDYWPLNRMSGARGQVSGKQPPPSNLTPRTPHLTPLLTEKWPFFLLSAASCVVTFLAQRGTAVASLESIPLPLRLSNAVVACAAYLWKAVWPAGLAVFYPLPKAIPAMQVIGAVALLAVLSVLAWRTRRTSPFLLTGWLWYLGTLVPVIGLVQVGMQSMADRYTYIPTMGLAVAVVFGIRDLVNRFPRLRTLIAPAAALVLGGLIFATERQLQFWRDPETLLSRAIAVTPPNSVVHQIRGAYLYDAGRHDQGLAEFREALRIGDSSSRQTPAERRYSIHCHLALARDYEERGALEEALAQYQIVLNAGAAGAEIHNDLGNLLDRMGRADEALAQYREALRLEPGASLAHCNLGTLLIKLGRFDEGMREYTEAARLNPKDPRPHYLAAKAWQKQGRNAEAIAEFRRALSLNPDDFQSATLLARMFAAHPDPQVRNGPEAIALAQRANTTTAGQQPFVLDALAMACAETGRFDEAQRETRKAIELARAAGETNMAAELQQRLELYQAGRPWRDALSGP